jgi:hypothetical protein
LRHDFIGEIGERVDAGRVGAEPDHVGAVDVVGGQGLIVSAARIRRTVEADIVGAMPRLVISQQGPGSSTAIAAPRSRLAAGRPGP